MKSGKKKTVTWNVDDLKFSNMDPKLNDKLAQWCEETYGSDNLGHVNVARRRIHNYLGIIIYFTQEGALNIDIKYYIEGVLE